MISSSQIAIWSVWLTLLFPKFYCKTGVGVVPPLEHSSLLCLLCYSWRFRVINDYNSINFVLFIVFSLSKPSTNCSLIYSRSFSGMLGSMLYIFFITYCYEIGPLVFLCAINGGLIPLCGGAIKFVTFVFDC